jgi:hypothetical protein
MAAPLSGHALAGVPFVTDDPVPLGKGNWEIDFATMDQWASDGVSGMLPLLEFDYGATDNIDLHVITQQTFDRPNSTGAMEYGYGDTELGAKFRFIQEDQLFKGCPEVATFPLVEVPTGDRNLGLGNGRAQAFIPIWMQKTWGPDDRQWSLYGGGGFWINPGPGNLNFGYMGIVLQKQIAEKLTIGGELYHSTVSADAQTAHTGFNLGGVYDFSDNWHAMLSIGRDIDGSYLLNTYAGIQLTF